MHIFTTIADMKNIRHDGAHQFKCAQCGEIHPLGSPGGFSTGYGYYHDAEPQVPICYKCCGEEDARDMRATGKGFMYLSKNDAGKWECTNWPGTLRIPVLNVKHSFHNFAGRNGRADFWFIFDGSVWHGVNIGHGQNARVRRTKERV